MNSPLLLSAPRHPAAVGLLLALVMLRVDAAIAEAPAHPFPQHADAYWQGVHVLPGHESRANLDDDVRALYDAWKARYVAAAGVEPDGHPRYRVKTGRDPGEPTVSEAQGSGMRIVALMAGHDPDARALFDGLYEFARDHPSTIDSRLMDWYVSAGEGPDGLGDDSAFDGDSDIALGLLLASAQWGDAGRFDYAAEAVTVLAGMAASTLGPMSALPLLGDWVPGSSAPYSQWTPRSSDFQPAHFRSFWVATDDVQWTSAIAATSGVVGAMQAEFAPTTGLLPDFMQPQGVSGLPLRPAHAGFLEGPNDGAYAYNATRVPLRLGIDALLFGAAGAAAQVGSISLWIESATAGDPLQIRAGYELDGTPLPGSGYFTTAFAAPLGVAAMTQPGQSAWLEAVYEAVHDSDESYYEDTLSLLCLLVMTGNYWHPEIVAPPTVPLLSSVAASALAVALAGTAMQRGDRRRRVCRAGHNPATLDPGRTTL